MPHEERLSAPRRTIVRAKRIWAGGERGLLEDHEVVIEDDLIVAVRPSGEDGASEQIGSLSPDIVDLNSSTLLPGLIDSHVESP